MRNIGSGIAFQSMLGKNKKNTNISIFTTTPTYLKQTFVCFFFFFSMNLSLRARSDNTISSAPLDHSSWPVARKPDVTELHDRKSIHQMSTSLPMLTLFSTSPSAGATQFHFHCSSPFRSHTHIHPRHVPTDF